MPRHLSFASTKKSTHIRRRYSHNVSRPQLTQENVNIDIQGSQSTLPENIQDDYDDGMDFQYDNEENVNNSENDNDDNEETEEDNNEETEEDNNEETEEDNSEETEEDNSEETEEDNSEETEEDNNEETEEDEYEEMEEDEYEEDDDNEETEEENEEDNDEEDEENEEDEGEAEVHIVDEALTKDKMPTYNNNEFAPYFENFTTASLFCWIQKHNISTSAYEDLAEIIHNPQFVSANVIKNIRRFRNLRQHLPLLPISANSISISSKKTPSTSKSSKTSYQLSINDIIWHVLNNPSLMKHMYFGPGINSEIKSEYWHGTLWGESPFYGEEKLIISQG
jgi:chemotaxis protein histidine kinase CheA